MTPYHPETNAQCKRFNQTIVSMIGMLVIKGRKHWKKYLTMLVHVYNCTKNNVTDFSPYHLMYGCKPQLPINIWFCLTSTESEEHSHSKFLAKLKSQVWQCYELAEKHQNKESIHQGQWHDCKIRASGLEPGDLCLVQQKVFGGKHKIKDHWVNTK